MRGVGTLSLMGVFTKDDECLWEKEKGKLNKVDGNQNLGLPFMGW
jgi:hypothetical protein